MFSCGKMIFSGDLRLPNPPRNLSGYGMVGSVRLGWDAPLGSAPLGYVVQSSPDGGLTWSSASFSSVIDPQYGGEGNVEGLDPVITYSFRVAATNALGVGAWSSTISVKPKAGPAAPGNVRAFRYRGWRSIGLFAPLRIFVDWDAPSSDMTITGYVVEMKEGGRNWGDKPTNFGTVTYEAAAQTSGTLAEDILDRYSVEDSDRLFRVKADTGGGYGPWSSPVTVQDGLGMSPGPVDWSAVGGNVTIFWDPPSDTKGYTLSGYVVKFAGVETFVTGTTTSRTVPTPMSGTIELRARYLNGPDVDAEPSSRSQVSLS